MAVWPFKIKNSKQRVIILATPRQKDLLLRLCPDLCIVLHDGQWDLLVNGD